VAHGGTMLAFSLAGTVAVLVAAIGVRVAAAERGRAATAEASG
jgi:hypothetical protein